MRFFETTELDRKALEDWAASLEKTASDLLEISKNMETHEIASIWSRNVKTGTTGYRDFCKMVGEIHTAFLVNLGSRHAPAVQEKKANYEKASKTAEKIQDKATNELKTVRKKKTS
jgi:hypothetical protein